MSEWLRGAVGGPIVASPMESRRGVLAPPELLNQARAARLIVASPVWSGSGFHCEPDHRPTVGQIDIQESRKGGHGECCESCLHCVPPICFMPAHRGQPILAADPAESGSEGRIARPHKPSAVSRLHM